VEELLVERGLEVNHTTVWRWVWRYAPEVEERTRPHLKAANKPLVRGRDLSVIKGRWGYLYRAIDSAGATIDFFLSPFCSADAAKAANLRGGQLVLERL
jgi:IS6 family transposase